MGGIDGFGRRRPEGGPFSTVDSEGGRIQRGLHRPISGEDPLHVASVRNGPTDSFRCVSKVSEDRATATGRAGCGTGPSFLGFSGPRASNMNAWRLAPSGRQAGRQAGRRRSPVLPTALVAAIAQASFAVLGGVSPVPGEAPARLCFDDHHRGGESGSRCLPPLSSFSNDAIDWNPQRLPRGPPRWASSLAPRSLHGIPTPLLRARCHVKWMEASLGDGSQKPPVTKPGNMFQWRPGGGRAGPAVPTATAFSVGSAAATSASSGLPGEEAWGDAGVVLVRRR